MKSSLEEGPDDEMGDEPDDEHDDEEKVFGALKSAEICESLY